MALKAYAKGGNGTFTFVMADVSGVDDGDTVNVAIVDGANEVVLDSVTLTENIDTDDDLPGGSTFFFTITQAQFTALQQVDDIGFVSGDDELLYFDEAKITVAGISPEEVIEGLLTALRDDIENNDSYTSTIDVDAGTITVTSVSNKHVDQEWTVEIDREGKAESNNVTATVNIDSEGVGPSYVRLTKRLINTTKAYSPGVVEVATRTGDPPTLALAKKTEANTLTLNNDVNVYLDIGDKIYFFQNQRTEDNPDYSDVPLFLGTVTSITGRTLTYEPNPSPTAIAGSQGDFFVGFKANKHEKNGVLGHFAVANVKVTSPERKEIFSVGAKSYVSQNR